MSWSIGYNEKLKRDIGYGVPAVCDHPDCNEKIDRGLAHCCGGLHPEQYGCGLHFCSKHLGFSLKDDEEEVDEDDTEEKCERCANGLEPFTPKPDVPEWIKWKLTDESWQQWRDENPQEVETLNRQVANEP